MLADSSSIHSPDITILVDTREKDTKRFKSRLDSFGYQYERVKLDFGDYSAKLTKSDGEVIDLSSKFSIERKMGLDECCTCFTKDRKRFENEFRRAKDSGARVYLLIEDANWEQIISHGYKSMMSPKSLLASLLSWQIRYGIHIIMCKNEIAGKMIRSIVEYEVKEFIKYDT